MADKTLWTDKELVAAVRRRDEDAAQALYDRYTDRVHAVCYRILLDRGLVLDCMQDIWLKFFRSVERLDVDGTLQAWLTRIAVNTAIDVYRKRRNNGVVVDMEDEGLAAIHTTGPVGLGRLEEAEVKEKVMAVLEQLSLPQRTAFVLRYMEDVPNSEIATILGCAEGTVRSHIRRSILALRKRLSNDLMEYMTS